MVTIGQIISAAKLVYDQVNTAKSNNKQSQLFADRLRRLINIIERHDHSALEKKVPETLPKLLSSINQAGALIAEFANRNWYDPSNLVKTSSNAAKFKEVNTALDQYVSELALDTQISFAWDNEESIKALKDDFKQDLSLLEQIMKQLSLNSDQNSEQMNELKNLKQQLEEVVKKMDEFKPAVRGKIVFGGLGSNVQADKVNFNRYGIKQADMKVPDGLSEASFQRLLLLQAASNNAATAASKSLLETADVIFEAINNINYPNINLDETMVKAGSIEFTISNANASTSTTDITSPRPQ